LSSTIDNWREAKRRHSEARWAAERYPGSGTGNLYGGRSIRMRVDGVFSPHQHWPCTKEAVVAVELPENQGLHDERLLWRVMQKMSAHFYSCLNEVVADLATEAELARKHAESEALEVLGVVRQADPDR
jgi:hypothetical protein